MTYKSVVNEVADKTGIDRGIIERTYMAYWKAIREHIVSLPLKQFLSDEEFLKLKPNVNIPSIGKLYVTLDRYQYINRSYKEYLNSLQDDKDKES